MDDRSGVLGRALGWLADHGVGAEQTCSSCGGAGTVTETRERTYEDLTGFQRATLLEAQLERERPDEETQREIERAKQQSQSAQNIGPSPVQNVSGPNP